MDVFGKPSSETYRTASRGSELVAGVTFDGRGWDAMWRDLGHAHAELDRRKAILRTLLDIVDDYGSVELNRRIRHELIVIADVRAQVTALFDAEEQQYLASLGTTSDRIATDSRSWLRPVLTRGVSAR